MMTMFAWSVLLILAALSSLCEGGCHQDSSEVLRICQPGTRTGPSIYIDTNTTIYGNELCSCSFTKSGTGNVEIIIVTGSVSRTCIINDGKLPNEAVKIEFFSDGDKPFHTIDCLQEGSREYAMDSTSQVRFNMTGHGSINSCFGLQVFQPGSQLTVVCERKIQVATTSSTSTTTSTTTTATTTTTRKTTAGATSAGATSAATSGRPDPSTSTTMTRMTSMKQPATSTKPDTSMAPNTATSPQTSMKSTDKMTTAPATNPTTTPAPPPPTEAPYKFPVPEVAGGVAAAIVAIILLVVCVTCCTSRRRRDSPKQDEEQLRPPGTPEMQERKGYDNLLYFANKQDSLGKSVSKSITPTISDADTQDYQATKGLEELYASVNKTITDSTDIM